MVLVVFICTGNICRSPMAEGIFRKKITDLGLKGVHVSSMGTHAVNGGQVSKTALELCAENGIDISNHQSRPLIANELVKSNLILTMEHVHREFLYSFFPVVKEKTFLLRAWPEIGTSRYNIDDPIGGSRRKYLNAYKEITKSIDRMMPEFLARCKKKTVVV